MNGAGTAMAEPVAQIIIAIIPIVGIVMAAVVIFFYLLWHHREVVRQIETGIYKKPVFDLYLFSVLAGFLLSGIGAVLTVLFLLVDGISYTLLGGLFLWLLASVC
ncbi:hypothetical protein [Brucepastera parasyntrophica]|uniref:hypothetical protein n=1 Tax=Brucepastera parasyntrophica TaxID=2880008 RepID=UPI0034E257FE